MKAPVMNNKQRRFFRLYFGKDERLQGNGTRCYQIVYECADRHSAQVSASRLLNRPEFKAWIDHCQQVAMAEIGVDAGFVKTQAVRIFARAMGDEPVTSTTITTDPETGNERIEHLERYDYDPGTALKALQLVGQHKEVQAFSQVVEHTHTHQLEQRLAARSKIIESSAQQIGSPGPGENAGGGIALPGVEKAKRGCIEQEVIEDREINEEKSASDNRGA